LFNGVLTKITKYDISNIKGFLMEILFALLFIFARWLIPPVFLLINIKNIINHKNYLKMAGECIILKQAKKLPRIFIIFYIVFAILGFYSLMKIKEWVYIFVIIFFLFFITIIISINLYTNINGIYKNAIIFNKYLSWDKINSYKWVNSETISFLLKNGNIVNFNKIINKEKIMEIIKDNKIMENSLL
jgi:uncharacterized protein (DUF983 family)